MYQLEAVNDPFRHELLPSPLGLSAGGIPAKNAPLTHYCWQTHAHRPWLVGWGRLSRGTSPLCQQSQPCSPSSLRGTCSCQPTSVGQRLNALLARRYTNPSDTYVKKQAKKKKRQPQRSLPPRHNGSRSRLPGALPRHPFGRKAMFALLARRPPPTPRQRAPTPPRQAVPLLPRSHRRAGPAGWRRRARACAAAVAEEGAASGGGGRHPVAPQKLIAASLRTRRWRQAPRPHAEWVRRHAQGSAAAGEGGERTCSQAPKPRGD